MNFKLISFLVVLLVCSLTPCNAVNLSEIQKNYFEDTKNLNGQNLVQIAVKLPELMKMLKEMDKTLTPIKLDDEFYHMKDSSSQSNSVSGKKFVSDANSIAKSLNDSFGNDKLSIISISNVEVSNLEKGDIIQIKNDNGFIRYVEYNGNIRSGFFTKNVIRKEVKGNNVKVLDTCVLVSYILKLQKIDLDNRRSKAEALLKRGIKQSQMKWKDIWSFPNLKNPKSGNAPNSNNTDEDPNDLLNGTEKMWLNVLTSILVTIGAIGLVSLPYKAIFNAILAHPYITLIAVGIILALVMLLITIMSIIWAITKNCGRINIKNAESELALIKREEEDWSNYQYIC